MESFLKNPFQNPFGGGMNPTGGGNGVLEQIQEQVNTNGESLQSLQGGIGGLPSGNLPPGGIGGGTVNRSDGPGGDIKPPTLGGMPPGYSGPAEKIIPGGPAMVTGPGGDLPPNDMGFPLDMFGKINVDELNKQNPGIEKGFFESDEYNKFHYDPGNMIGTMNISFSPYFGQQGSGSVGAAEDAAYEAYLKRIGKSDLIGKTIPGLSDNPLNPGLSDNIFGLNDITQPIPGSSNFTPAPRPPHLESGMLNSQNMFDRQTGQTGALGQMGGMNQLFGRAFAGKPI